MDSPFASLFEGEKKYSFKKGQILVYSDLEPRGVIYLHSGYVKAYDIDSKGEYKTITIISPGNFFPLYWSLDSQHSQLFHESMSAGEYSVMPKDEFKKAVDEDSTLTKAALALTLRAFKYSQERILNLELSSARERLAFRLLFLAQYYGSNENGAIEIDAPQTYQDYAECLNMTRDTVNRVMRDFIAAGWIYRSDHKITVLDKAKLKEILHHDIALDI